jgi:hypothetical protein
MFESFEEGERQRGLKGFIARHFGPVVHLDVTEEGIRQIGLVFMGLAALTGIVGMVVNGNPFALLDGLIVAVPAFILYLSKSRAAAIVLLVVAVANALLFLGRPLLWVWVAFAVRATQLTFGYYRLKQLRTTALKAME